MKHHFLLYFLMCFFLATPCFSQIQLKENAKEYYGIDKEHKLIVIHKSFIDSLVLQEPSLTSLNLANTSYTIDEAPEKFQLTKSYILKNDGTTFEMYVTTFPIIKIETKDSIVDEPKVGALFHYVDEFTSIHAALGIELRGNSALKYPKKSYDIEIRESITSEKSRDIQPRELRNDDDWILNSLYNEPLKLRSYFASKLWLDVHKLSYKENGERPQSMNNSFFAEVFLNNRYQGIYLFSEPVDRKLLGLKKIKNDTVYGELFKAGSYQDVTSFKAAPEYKNSLPTWGGFEMEYPYENYEAHWENLYKLLKVASDKDDTYFKTNIQSHIDIDNVIDYFLFVNLLRATDNLGKNYFLARHTRNKPYFFVPWDLDGVLGSIQDGKRIDTTDDILSNALFERLLVINPSNYKGKVKARWEELRSHLYSNEELFGRLDTIYSALNSNKIYERDNLLWPRAVEPEEDFFYMKNWLEKRLRFLDSYFASFQ